MDKRSLALDGGNLPFGALRLPAIVENIRIAADNLRDDAVSRRIVSIVRRACMLGRPDPFDVDVFGLCRARLYPRSNRCEKRVFMGVNFWEFDERQSVLAAISEGPRDRPFVFIDGGANVGLYSLFVASEARRLGRSVNIIAIEPDPTNLERLRFNLKASEVNEIRVVPCALGDKEQTGLLFGGDRNRGEVRLVKENETVEADVEVPVTTLPHILENMGIKNIDVLKLDIEGSEYLALSSLFSETPVALWPSMIVLEVGKGANLSDAYRLCIDRGYVLAKRTSLNAVLRRSGEMSTSEQQMESKS